MGEKGIAADAPSAAVVTGVVGETTSVIERAGTVVTTSVTAAGADLADAMRDKSIEVAADHLVAEGRERIREADDRAADDPDAEPRTATDQE